MLTFTFLLFLCAGIFLVTGLIMWKFPPKEINSLYGYRTRASMEDDASWELAQKVSTNWMLRIGTGYFILGALGFPLELHEGVEALLGMAVVIAGVIVLFVKVEGVLKKGLKN